MKIIFYLGKGGVGKSSLSILSALAAAKQASRVALISLDRAHNLFDILQRKPSRLSASLTVVEADIDRFIRAYLQNTEAQLRHSYQYLSAINLEKHFKVLRLAPGMEEYGLLLAFRHYYQKFKKYDYLIFDMPPTAVALKFFGLPSVSLVWLEQLLRLREEILQKKEIISSVKFGHSVIETDKIKKNLLEQKSEYDNLLSLFRDKERCLLNVVSTPDSVALAESERIGAFLSELQIPVHKLVINKSPQRNEIVRNTERFAQNEICFLPEAHKPLIGMENLQDYLRESESWLKLLVT